MNLLIVDDTPTDLKLLRAQLEAEGHTVFEARDGVDALAVLERQHVDMVISDILMPRMDGYRLCYEIRKHARLHDLPIIIYTASFISPGDEKLALDLSADKYLKKPASVETIIAALHEVIAKPHAAPRPEALQGIEVLQEYSKRLVSKLEEKNIELMASEVKFRTVVEQSVAGIYIAQDDQFVYVNPGMTGIFGWSEEEMTSRTISDFIVPEDLALARENIRQRISGEVSSNRYSLRMLHQSGAVLQVEVHGSQADYNGRPAAMGMVVDITERLLFEAQLRQTQRMEGVGQLASGIAHDFNNLLTVINGMSEFVLAQISQDDPVHADVQEIHRAGERAATLTRQLLAFSRQQILEPRVLNFNTMAAGIESLLRRLLGEDIDLSVVLTPGLSNVKADPGQIEQVITNLAVNARDAMPQGGHLTIETQNVTIDEDYTRQHGVAVPPGSYVLLTVSDSGVGMDEATRARIFEPFFTTKDPGKGTGLGLSTVYGIVKQSDGFVWVHSKVGQGTSFKIYLPQVTEAAGTDRPGPTVVSSSGTETILLVEDDAGLRKVATRILEPAGYTVLLSSTGEEALELLERHEEPVHLLLSDVVMPGMSGRQLAERLAQARPGMKVLYMSGYTSDTILRHGVSEAQVPFLNKPFTAAALVRKVREVLDS